MLMTHACNTVGVCNLSDMFVWLQADTRRQPQAQLTMLCLMMHTAAQTLTACQMHLAMQQVASLPRKQTYKACLPQNRLDLGQGTTSTSATVLPSPRVLAQPN